jgi:hypothetical protein
LRTVIRAYRRALSCRGCATRRDTRTCVFANREDVGRVDHPEHHAQARPKWNGGYKLIVRSGATANEKKRSCPRFGGVYYDRKQGFELLIFVVGSDRTRTCNQNAISGWITVGFVDFTAFLLDFDRVRCGWLKSTLVKLVRREPRAAVGGLFHVQCHLLAQGGDQLFGSRSTFLPWAYVKPDTASVLANREWSHCRLIALQVVRSAGREAFMLSRCRRREALGICYSGSIPRS